MAGGHGLDSISDSGADSDEDSMPTPPNQSSNKNRLTGTLKPSSEPPGFLGLVGQQGRRSLSGDDANLSDDDEDDSDDEPSMLRAPTINNYTAAGGGWN